MLSSRPLTRVFLGSGLLLALPAVLAALLAGCDRQSGQSTQPQASDSPAPGSPGNLPAEPAPGVDRSHKGTPLPALTFKDTAGHTLHLAAATGQPLLVNLWATWCAPCVAELPTLDKLAASRAGKLRVITLSQDMSGGNAVAAFLTGKGLTHLTPWLDPQASAAAGYGVSTLPTTIYYDAQGHELWRWAGGMDWTSAKAATLLGEAGAP